MPPALDGEDAALDEIHLLDRVECTRIEHLDKGHDLRNLATAYDRENDLHGAAGTLAIQRRHPVLLVAKSLNQLSGVPLGYDPNEHHTQRQPLGDPESDVIARGKSTGIGEVTNGIGQILHDLSYDQDPDQHFEKARDGRQVLEPSRYEDQAHRAQTDVHDPRQENEEGQDDPGVDR